MHEALKKLTSNMAFAGALLISAGFIVAENSPAPQSIGVALIFLHPFFNGGIKKGLRNIYTNGYALVLAIYYVLLLVSVFHFGDMQQYGQLMVMQLPLIFLPFGLSDPEAIPEKKKHIVFGVLVAAVVVAGVASYINYLIHFDEINELIKHSKPVKIVTGVNHIYFSIIMAFCAGYLQWRLFIKGISGTRYKAAAWAALAIIIFILHTISARTGLICFYAEEAVSILWLIFKTRRFLMALGIIAGLVALVVITVTLVPSERNRLANTRLDLHKYSSGDNINHYSLSMRFEALKTGFEVFKKHPVTGVGPANISDAMFAQYAEDHSQLIKDNQIKPHNEFLYDAITMGVIGLAALLAMLLLPVFNGTVFRSYPFLMFIVVCIASFQVEYVLERQVGITFFCLFYILLSQMAPRKLSSGTLPQ